MAALITVSHKHIFVFVLKMSEFAVLLKYCFSLARSILEVLGLGTESHSTQPQHANPLCTSDTSSVPGTTST